MSIRYYISLVEALTAVPPTEGPTSTPEEQTIGADIEASDVDIEASEQEPGAVQKQVMPAVD
jgi:hypothetical protein